MEARHRSLRCRMWKRALLRRVVALQLLLLLPAGLGARLCLDARWTVDSYGHVEVEHHDACARAHDHRLCVLLFHTPLSPAPTLPGVASSAPIADAAPAGPSDAPRSEQVRLTVARSPPLSI